MQRVAIYMRHSIADLAPERQRSGLFQFLSTRGYEAEVEYVDHGMNEAEARRPALDRMLKDAAEDRFDSLLVLSCDRVASDARQLLKIVEKLNQFGIRFRSLHDEINTRVLVAQLLCFLSPPWPGSTDLLNPFRFERVCGGLKWKAVESVALRWTSIVPLSFAIDLPECP